MSATKTVLFATDFSEPARRAFVVARKLCHGPGDRLILLHVLRPPSPRVKVGRSVISVPPGARQQEARTALNALNVSEAGVEVERLIFEGHTVEQILRVALEHRCDWIVLGSRGACDSEDRQLGSVTSQVLRRAPCPVVMVGAAAEPATVALDPVPGAHRFSAEPTSTRHRRCAVPPE